MTVRLWLVRHGATVWSESGRFCGWSDVPLNAAGRRQARALRERLAREGFAGVWTSDLARAGETARLAVGEAAADRRLRELDFGDLEGRRWEECAPDVREALLRFDGFRAPGGESVNLFRHRVLAFVEGLPEGAHLLVTHGGVIRVLLREAGRMEVVPPGGLRRVAF